jgi:hypothetical protein
MSGAIGGVVGSVLGGRSSGGSQQVVQSNDFNPQVKPFVEPYLRFAYNQAYGPNAGFQQYGGQRIAPVGGLFSDAIQKQAAQGANNPITAANSRLTTDTLAGNYLRPDSNPYLRDSVNDALGMAKSQINSQFMGNNFGGSAHSETLGRSLGTVATNAFRQNYDTERQNQIRQSLIAPQVSASGYQDSAAMQQAAEAERGERQRYNDLAYGQFQEQQQYPFQMSNFFGNALSRTIGSPGQSVTETPGGSSAAGALGGGLLGYGLGSMLNRGSSNPSSVNYQNSFDNGSMNQILNGGGVAGGGNFFGNLLGNWFSGGGFGS